MTRKFDQKEVVSILKSAGLQASPQRTRILQYILENNIHPTADDIYIALKDEMSSLSRATVYNTLKILVQYEVISKLNIGDELESRYDGMTVLHAHFTCKECKKVYDIPINKTLFDLENLKGFEVENKKICLSGICPDCK